MEILQDQSCNLLTALFPDLLSLTPVEEDSNIQSQMTGFVVLDANQFLCCVNQNTSPPYKLNNILSFSASEI